MAFPPSAARSRLARAGNTAKSRVGAGVIFPYVSVAELDELDALMRHLNTDVLKLAPGAAPTINTPEWAAWSNRVAKLIEWKWEWTSYFIAWSFWRDDHYGEFARLGDEVRQEYDNWVASYNERLRSFKQDWGESSTGAQAKEPAGQKAAGEIGGIADLVKLGLLAYFGVLIFKEVRKR